MEINTCSCLSLCGFVLVAAGQVSPFFPLSSHQNLPETWTLCRTSCTELLVVGSCLGWSRNHCNALRPFHQLTSEKGLTLEGSSK